MPDLSDSALRLFEYLPATYGATPEDLDPLVARWLEALAGELDRIRALLLVLRGNTIPAKADDAAGALTSWERVLELPVSPEDVSVARRQATLRATLIGRIVASGERWGDAMTAMIRSEDWTVERNTPAPEHLTITIPFEAGSPTAMQVEAFALRRSPATQIIVMAYAGRFVVGGSDVGAPI